MAQKLHDTYGYSYDNLKVLLGGWNSWKNAGYPTATSAPPPSATPGGAPGASDVIILTPGAAPQGTPIPLVVATP